MCYLQRRRAASWLQKTRASAARAMCGEAALLRRPLLLVCLWLLLTAAGLLRHLSHLRGAALRCYASAGPDACDSCLGYRALAPMLPSHAASLHGCESARTSMQ